MKILLAGGDSDVARYFKNSLDKESNLKIFCPGKRELDVSSRESIDRYFLSLPKIDCFINAAGSIHPMNILDSSEERWLNDINVNFISNYLISKKVIKSNKKAKLIFISSAAAFNVYKNWSSYCISKQATVSLTKHLSKEGFNAYCVCPGGIETKFRKKININNLDMLSLKEVCDLLKDIVFSNKNYKSGDCILFKKNVLEIK